MAFACTMLAESTISWSVACSRRQANAWFWPSRALGPRAQRRKTSHPTSRAARSLYLREAPGWLQCAFIIAGFFRVVPSLWITLSSTALLLKAQHVTTSTTRAITTTSRTISRYVLGWWPRHLYLCLIADVIDALSLTLRFTRLLRHSHSRDLQGTHFFY